MTKEEIVEVRCPVCNEIVRIPVEEAERTMRATCPKGHDVPLARALG